MGGEQSATRAKHGMFAQGHPLPSHIPSRERLPYATPPITACSY
jgi:hypothetical protein